MAYKFEEELRTEAAAFVKALDAAGFAASIVPDSFRDYSVKLSIHKNGRSFGKAILSYSTKKGISLQTHELRDASTAPELNEVWEQHTRKRSKSDLLLEAPSGWCAYVDGSCTTGGIGFGLVILRDGQRIDERHGAVTQTTLLDMQQIGGELQAVYEVLDWCNLNAVQEITIYYDYEGIEKWVTGEWRANKAATEAYASKLKSVPLQISWHKVKSHSGDYWNEYADRLAMQGTTVDMRDDSEYSQDPLAEVIDAAHRFAAFLQKHGIHCSFSGHPTNGQFARVQILPQEGVIDIYNTKKRSPDKPYFHDFRDPEVERLVKERWQVFQSEKRVTPQSEETGLDAIADVSYYYEILRPYGECAFDFEPLAKALNEACIHLGHPSIDVNSMRYDFGELECIYRSLKGSI